MAKNKQTRQGPEASNTFLIVVALVFVAAMAYVFVRPYQGGPVSETSPAPAVSDALPAQAAPSATPETAAGQTAAPKKPARGDLPPLPLGGYPAIRPPEVIRAVYEFAARHPEVLQYVPCYCGCERNGHRGNDDCFVRSRDAEGRVTWDGHGMG